MEPYTNSPDRFSTGPSVFSTFGLLAAILLLFLEALLIPIDLLFGIFSHNVRIFIYLLAPAVLVASLALVPIGQILETQRRKSIPTAFTEMDSDEEDHLHRLRTGIFIGITPMFLILTSIGTFQAYNIVQMEKVIINPTPAFPSPAMTHGIQQSDTGLDCQRCHQDWKRDGS